MIYAIGDIHGENGMLTVMLTELRSRVKKKDHVVFLGDYIDRGPNSKDVINQVIAFKKEHENTVCLRGNHEQMFLDAQAMFQRYKSNDTDEWSLWWLNGGFAMAKSYDASKATVFVAVPDEHIHFMQHTEMECSIGSYRFVHAGFLPDGEIFNDAPHDPRIWIRNQFINSDQDFGGIVVFGHTPQRSGRPLIMANKICLDTAAVFGGPLSMGVFKNNAKGEDRIKFDLIQVGNPE